MKVWFSERVRATTNGMNSRQLTGATVRVNYSPPPIHEKGIVGGVEHVTIRGLIS